MTRRLLQLALVLALVVLGASSTLRLAANGIGCSPWPSCYGRAVTAQAANATPLARALRLAHRVAASAFAFVVLAAVAVGWRRWRGPERSVGAALLAVTVVLAWVGRYTPSPLPAVTLVNLLGGLALLALLGWLITSTTATAVRGRSESSGLWLPLLLVALVVQAGGGALISARMAGDACAAGCDRFWLSGAAALFDPLREGTAAQLVHPLAGQTLQALHRLGGLALALATIVAAFAALHRRQPRAAAMVMLAAAAVGALGFAVAAPQPALASAALHALAVGLLFAALAAAGAMRGATPQERPT
jgi:cytochrome c oxidase assembly protein subunit 15